MKRLSVLLAAVLLLMLTACNARTEKHNVSGADGVVIALIDTGVSTVAIDEERLLPGYNYVSDSDDTEDRINHGTAVASIISGCAGAEVTALAPDALLVPLVVADKVDGTVQSVTPEVLAQAIRDSVDIYGADIINVSLGIQKDDEALREAVTYAAEKNVAVISAVGNGGEDGKPYYPAAYDTVLAVGSCDRDGVPSDFTQNGADMLAPGEDIMLASRNGVPYGIKGTSFATGFVSAYLANLLAKQPDLPPETLFDLVVEHTGGVYLPS